MVINRKSWDDPPVVTWRNGRSGAIWRPFELRFVIFLSERKTLGIFGLLFASALELEDFKNGGERFEKNIKGDFVKLWWLGLLVHCQEAIDDHHHDDDHDDDAFIWNADQIPKTK